MFDVLICGSGFSIQQINQWDLKSHIVVAVNNAHGHVTWNYFSCSEDYEHEFETRMGIPFNLVPIDYKNQTETGNWFNQQSMMYAVEKCGGWERCGRGSMLATTYCVLTYFKNTIKRIGFIGADMVYDSGNEQTAFYGRGVDFQKRNMSDPMWMAKEHKRLQRKHINPYYNKKWGNLTDDEVIFYFYKRLELYAHENYNIELVNYSTQENSLLPYERKTYI